MLSINHRLRVDGLWEEVRSARDDVLCLRLLADLDLATEAVARARLARLCRDDAVRYLLLRVGPDRFIDLRGLDLLVDASTWMRDRGRWLIVAEPPGSLRLLVDTLDLSGQLRLVATVRQAMALADAA